MNVSSASNLPFRSSVEEYERQAVALLAELRSNEESAQWRFKWAHPRFRGKGVDDVRAATGDLADVRLLVAREYHFDTWEKLNEFAVAVLKEGPILWFETAV